MSRSSWKGKYLYHFFTKKKTIKKFKNQTLSIWSRSSIIPYYLVGKSVKVYSGNKFFKIPITLEKVGYKFGEFVYTRKHTQKIKKTNNITIKKVKK